VSTVDVTVVMVTYQSADDLEASLSALDRATQSAALELVVVDNGSSDGTLDVVGRVAPGATLVAGHGNVGFARACHLGAERGVGRFILFLNPDTELRPGAVDALLAAADAYPEAGLWGGRTLRPDGRVELTCAAGAIDAWSLTCFALGLNSLLPGNRWFDPESLGSWQRDTPREVPQLSGACLMVSRLAWERLGGFDRQYFMYAEDADLCRRAWLTGYRPRLVPQAEVVHSVGSSSNPGRKQVMLHRGKATYVRRNFPPLQRRYGLLCLWLGVALRGRLATALQPKGDERRRTAPSSWSYAWDQRREWLPGW
jgi:N-acetylglucosaminyl-diphospho-decaprenol L-rhamnosyltransferase